MTFSMGDGLHVEEESTTFTTCRDDKIRKLENPQLKREQFAMDLRKSKRRDLIASKRELRSSKIFSQGPKSSICDKKIEDPPINTSQIESLVKDKDDSHVKDKDEIRVKDIRETDTQTYAMYTCGHHETR
jgi:hypothetical protein